MHASTSNKITELTEGQWGMFTASQAKQVCLSQVALSRLVAKGSLQRMRWGVYRVPTAPDSRLNEHRAAWLSLRPELPAWKRLARPEKDFVFAGFSAAWIRNVSDQIPASHEFITPTLSQRKSSVVKLRRQASLSKDQVQIVDGLPTLSPNALIEDLSRSTMDVDDLFRVVSQIGIDAFDYPSLIASLTRAMKRYGWAAEDVRYRLLEDVEQVIEGFEAIRQNLEAVELDAA